MSSSVSADWADLLLREWRSESVVRSSGRWADRTNDLIVNPSIRKQFQFWFFIYQPAQEVRRILLVHALNGVALILCVTDSLAKGTTGVGIP
ncbi:MAG: hypothetical protein ABIP82_09975 [Nitrospirales bacterium]